jgi:hypothetical protein
LTGALQAWERTFESSYIIKNAVFVSAGLECGCKTVGGGLTAKPEAVQSVREPGRGGRSLLNQR